MGGNQGPLFPAVTTHRLSRLVLGIHHYPEAEIWGWREEGPAQASVTLPGWGQRTKAQPGWSVVPVRLESQHGLGLEGSGNPGLGGQAGPWTREQG